MAGVKKADIKASLAKKFRCQNQEDRIAVFGLKAKYGGGRSSGFATIYDDLDARKLYDTKPNLERVSASPFGCRVSQAIVLIGAFLCLILIFNYFNRTTLSKGSKIRAGSSARSSRERERESRVPPSPRSRPVRRRSDSRSCPPRCGPCRASYGIRRHPWFLSVLASAF